VDAHDILIGSDKAVSIGLVVTELVINAIKYAFPIARPKAQIMVAFIGEVDDWTLTVSDNGVGKSEISDVQGGGLGTAIVEALVKQLGARLVIKTDGGTQVSIRRGAASGVSI